MCLLFSVAPVWGGNICCPHLQKAFRARLKQGLHDLVMASADAYAHYPGDPADAR